MNRPTLLEYLADRVLSIERTHPLRVAIDGFSASGKTTLADHLVSPIERRGRPVVRASLDNFKRPWSESHLYDRVTGEGYYRNAYDYSLVRQELLEPLGPGGSRRYRSAAIDPLTGSRFDDAVGVARDDAVLLVDAVFLFRPELNDLWDFRVFIDIDMDLILERGLRRDIEWEDSTETVEDLYRTRYIPSEELYVREVDPARLADILIDNRNFDDPRIIRGLTTLERLATERLTLRRPTHSDVDTIHGIHNDPRTVDHNPGDMLHTLQDALELYERWHEHWEQHGYGYFSVDRQNDGTTIGFCGIKSMTLRGQPVLNLFYRFGPAYWGHGFASEAVAAMVRYVDTILPDHVLIARVRPKNLASRRILEKLGLTERPELAEVGDDGFELIYTLGGPLQ